MTECCFDGCSKPATTKKWALCRGHAAQRRRGRDLTPLHDQSVRAASLRAFWAGLDPDERQRRVAALVISTPKGERSEQWRRRLSESHRARWAEGKAEPRLPRRCRGCDVEFAPHSGSHWYCTKDCYNLTRRCQSRGISRADYNALLAEQGGKCALCGSDARGYTVNHALHIDHCHKTGRVRGLLCGDCNTALGRFGDDPERLRAAADYLLRLSTP